MQNQELHTHLDNISLEDDIIIALDQIVGNEQEILLDMMPLQRGRKFDWMLDWYASAEATIRVVAEGIEEHLNRVYA